MIPIKLSSKIINPRRYSGGFTLIELLAAVSLTTIVVGAAGFGVATIMNANAESESKTQRRVQLNRALDYITEDIRRAKTATDDPTTLTTDWSWDSNLGAVSASPTPKLYLEIPLSVESVSKNDDTITIPNHGFSSGNAVMFTKDGTVVSLDSKNKVYYVVMDKAAGTDRDHFQVATSLTNAKNDTEIDLTANSSGNLTANQLLIYYIRNNTGTWLDPQTINRSAGSCSLSANCSVLVDAIAKNGFTTSVTSEKRVGLNLTGKLEDDLYEVNTKAFARSANP
jgi:type II secretory pathway pseudopilin PulG